MQPYNYPSKYLENAVEEFAKLPGIGRRTALRLVLHLLNKPKEEVEQFSATLNEMVQNIHFCSICHNISDNDICSICSSTSRDKTTICVVETIKDVMSIENTMQYKGLYHVLGGVINPMEGVGPADLNIESLVNRLKSNDINEVIMALSATTEGDTTNFYIYKKIKDYNIVVTTLARGVAFGNELEYTDEITLGRALLNRVKFNNSFSVE
ncbi:recombination mediator RecR [Tenuifilum thalassicum]|jgi:recombination protein RecR|uniref:Recombination protein RecR n=1 Tax=Tenuifilum thalassicum TaxID=2590900 RepID=A0A7D4CA25_9BACT|nr:recombination mediator RecR [Tenuifilum thalassicum]QKG80482.1 recombination protein RecR [Tenuifilum thalassicum]